MVVYFSGTGNSKYIAERIAGSLQEKLLCMNEQIKSGDTGTVKTGENLVVVVPTYAWRIPRVVSDWIGQTEFVGAKNVWYVMSCGSGIGGADIYNRKLSEKKGLKAYGGRHRSLCRRITLPCLMLLMWRKQRRSLRQQVLILLKLCWQSNMERSFHQKVASVHLLRVVW